MSELLSIGEFSSRSGLSPKALRLYAKAGLLVPAAVDPSNGYRYYDVNQLSEASLVVLLRRAGVPVADITAFLRSPTEEQLDRWERDADIDFRGRRQALLEARERAGFSAGEKVTRHSGIDEIGGSKMLHLRWGSATDVGQVRPSNQDAVLAANHLFAVADGMGGQGGGEMATQVALDALSAVLVPEFTSDRLFEAAREAGRAVWSRVDDLEDLAEMGMGTTLTAAALVIDDGKERLAVVNVGDSRAYLLREGQLAQITDDHSVVGELIRAGALTEEEARTHPQRSILTRVLGMGPDVEPDMCEVAPGAGDRLLLCTDGLYNEITEAEIKDALAAASGPVAIAQELVTVANTRGGRDNASAIVVEFISSHG